MEALSPGELSAPARGRNRCLRIRGRPFPFRAQPVFCIRETRIRFASALSKGGRRSALKQTKPPVSRLETGGCFCRRGARTGQVGTYPKIMLRKTDLNSREKLICALWKTLWILGNELGRKTKIYVEKSVENVHNSLYRLFAPCFMLTKKDTSHKMIRFPTCTHSFFFSPF